MLYARFTLGARGGVTAGGSELGVGVKRGVGASVGAGVDRGGLGLAAVVKMSASCCRATVLCTSGGRGAGAGVPGSSPPPLAIVPGVASPKTRTWTQ